MLLQPVVSSYVAVVAHLLTRAHCKHLALQKGRLLTHFERKICNFESLNLSKRKIDIQLPANLLSYLFVYPFK
jgi:hypothetical protein